MTGDLVPVVCENKPSAGFEPVCPQWTLVAGQTPSLPRKAEYNHFIPILSTYGRARSFLLDHWSFGGGPLIQARFMCVYYVHYVVKLSLK